VSLNSVAPFDIVHACCQPFSKNRYDFECLDALGESGIIIVTAYSEIAINLWLVG